MNIEQKQRLSWRAILIGGSSGIGIAAFTGTLVANVSLYLALSRGMSIHDAYAEMARDPLSIASLSAEAIHFMACSVGGYVAASLVRGRSLQHGFLAGTLGFCFSLVMYSNPSSMAGTLGQMIWNLLAPVGAGVVGAAIYARRSLLSKAA
jgi:hypothetical protein